MTDPVPASTKPTQRQLLMLASCYWPDGDLELPLAFAKAIIDKYWPEKYNNTASS